MRKDRPCLSRDDVEDDEGVTIRTTREQEVAPEANTNRAPRIIPSFSSFSSYSDSVWSSSAAQLRLPPPSPETGRSPPHRHPHSYWIWRSTTVLFYGMSHFYSINFAAACMISSSMDHFFFFEILKEFCYSPSMSKSRHATSNKGQFQRIFSERQYCRKVIVRQSVQFRIGITGEIDSIQCGTIVYNTIR